MTDKIFQVDIWHNILWSRYKAVVFSELYRIAAETNYRISISHIAETDVQRLPLSQVDVSAHAYPYACLFEGAYSNVPTWRIALELGRRATTSRADLTIVPCYNKPEYWVQAVILWGRGKKIGVFCDSTKLDRRQTFLKTLVKRLFFRMCQCTFAYGVRSKEYAEYMGMQGDRVFANCQAAAVPNRFTSDYVRQQRQRTTSAAPMILYVGRLSPEKGLDIVLRAFTAVLARRPDARLIIVGGGPQKDELQQLAEALGIEQNVVFAGAKQPDELWPYYLQANCFVLGSRREPWGLVVNEALTLGCPVVVSDRCGCIAELVVDGVTGYSFPCDDIDALADRLLKVLQSPHGGAELIDGCLSVIGRHTPAVAARAILSGIQVTLERR